MEFSADYGWLFLAYFLGTAIGIYFGFRHGVLTASNSAIDALIAMGFLRHKKSETGEVELLKWNAVCDDQTTD